MARSIFCSECNTSRTFIGVYKFQATDPFRKKYKALLTFKCEGCHRVYTKEEIQTLIREAKE